MEPVAVTQGVPSQGTRLTNKVALVTGAGSGFGAAISTRFAHESCRVLVCDINVDGANSTVKSIAKDDTLVRSHKMDVTVAADWDSAVGECERIWGRLDVVVNNAGTSYKNKPSLDVTPDEFDRVFTVNVKSLYLSVQAAIPSLKKNEEHAGGSIINISSIGSVRPRPGLVFYNASKAAVSNATKGLAAEFGPSQIRVNAIAPLLCGTGLFENFVGVPYTPENVAKFVTQVPLGRLTETSDVANAALYLASEEGRFLTGLNLEVDGGKGI